MSEKAKKLVDILLLEKLITKEQLDEVKKEQKSTGVSIQKILVSRGFITSEGLAKALAHQLEIPYLKLTDENISPQLIKMIPEDTARLYKAIAVKLEVDTLYVAFAFPLNLPARDEIKLITGYKIAPMVATEKEIDQAINQYYKVEETSKQNLIDMRMQGLKEKKQERTVSLEDELGKVEDLPIVRLVNDIINGAIKTKVSDIHLEPQEPEMIVRYRIDGILHDIMTIPKHVELRVISRIKILANMDITERRRPQDGHITMKKDDKDYDFRVSTMLAIGGEKIVIRILERSSMLIGLNKLGLSEHDQKLFRLLIAKPYGMILVTGPTGSGKTTTLYTLLSQLDSKAANIITIEEPVEYRLNRITQVQVDFSSKMTFAKGLRTILRQDPDVVMIGEIRDRETAEIAVQAALTGHLVFSTLHTNDAPSAITRLIDMGVEPFLISSTVIGVIAQRLCRKICPECKTGYTPIEEELQFLQDKGGAVGDIKLAKGKGCGFCYQTGFKGRAGIFEVMKLSDEIRKMIVERRPAMDIKKQAVKEGMRTLQHNGLEKIKTGVSTIEEVKRVVYVEGV